MEIGVVLRHVPRAQVKWATSELCRSVDKLAPRRACIFTLRICEPFGDVKSRSTCYRRTTSKTEDDHAERCRSTRANAANDHGVLGDASCARSGATVACGAFARPRDV